MFEVWPQNTYTQKTNSYSDYISVSIFILFHFCPPLLGQERASVGLHFNDCVVYDAI